MLSQPHPDIWLGFLSPVIPEGTPELSPAIVRADPKGAAKIRALSKPGANPELGENPERGIIVPGKPQLSSSPSVLLEFHNERNAAKIPKIPCLALREALTSLEIITDLDLGEFSPDEAQRHKNFPVRKGTGEVGTGNSKLGEQPEQERESHGWSCTGNGERKEKELK
ncbi:hypothetical protein TURU_001304 [Turdus rufiventris]|nr:hypothetical protein TURU_001304 [Turdus rufiventris]